MMKRKVGTDLIVIGSVLDIAYTGSKTTMTLISLRLKPWLNYWSAVVETSVTCVVAKTIENERWG
jgi:hypothetical protein